MIEGPNDLAYRGVLPRALGWALLDPDPTDPLPAWDTPLPEEFALPATLRCSKLRRNGARPGSS